MATRLSELEVEEISGVENPANELPGFLVTKARKDNLTAEELLKEVDRMEQDVAILYSSLSACEPYLADAGEDVKAAAATLTAWVENLFKDEEPTPSDDDDEGSAPEPIGLSRDKNSGGLLERLGLRRSKTTKTAAEEPDVSETTKVDEPEVTEPEVTEPESEEPVEKSTALSLEDVTKAVQDALAPVVTQLGELGETTETLKSATGAVIDRLSAVEAGRQGLDPEEIAEITTKSKTELPRGEAALRAGFGRLARGETLRLG